MATPDDLDPTGVAPIAEPLRPASDAPRAGDQATDHSAVAATTDGVAFSTRNAGPGKLRAGAVAGAAVALAVGAVATSLAASPPQAPAQVATTTTSGGAGTGTGTGNGAGGLAPVAISNPGAEDDDETLDLGRNGGRGMHSITITAISGNSVSLRTDDGWTRTITVTDAVEVTKGGQDIAVSDLAVGDEVRISQTRNDDGTWTVDGLVVIVPSVRGEVSDVTSSGFKVTTRGDTVWTITVDASTEYRFGTGTGSLADVTNGTRVTVLGESTGDNALKALTVAVPADEVVGTVKSKTADTIVIEKRDGTTVTVHVDGDTTYRVRGVDDADLGDVAVDMAIGVSGRERADGSIDADAIVGGKGGGWFRGGNGFGRGHGDDDDERTAPSASPSAS